MLGFLRRLPGEAPHAAALVAPSEPPAPGTPSHPLDNALIPDEATFTALSIPAGDLVANGRLAKFLIDLRGASPLVHFINGNFTRDGKVPEAALYHYFFAREAVNAPESLDDFNRLTYFTQPKTRYVAGVVHTYFLEGGSRPLYGIQFYPQDLIAEGDVLRAVREVKEAMPIPGARFAFVPTGAQQTASSVKPDLAAAGIEVVPIDRILGSILYLPMNLGEAWGYLRIFPESNDDLYPGDIPVFEELPLDLSVVAGVITRAVQDANSHVNLKSKERGTPNMVLRDAGPDNPRLQQWADKPVHLVVRGDDFLLEASTDEQVAAKLAERDSRPWVPLAWDEETYLRTYDEMAAGDAGAALGMSSRYGGKAANLGFLVHRTALGRVADTGSPSAGLGYDLVPKGFGIPLSFYRNFVNAPDNAQLKAKLKALIAAEKAAVLTPAERILLAAEVQSLFLNGRMPDGDLTAIKERFAASLVGVEKVKVRSSANAEDIPNFDGAGLHDSYSCTVAKKDNKDWSCIVEEEEEGVEVKRKVKPKSIACAVKGVYASLWNKRAIEERSFARIDHASVAMGSAIVPSYDLESEVAANAVVITRVVNATGVYGYSLSIQLGNNLVTNPDPGTWTEVTVAAIGLGDEPTSLTVTRYAKPAKDGPERTEPVLTRDQTLRLVEIAMAVEKAYCAADATYYPNGDCTFVVVDNDKPKSLDMEFKVLADGRFVCKQVREFAGR
ncbi:MAG TPA: PEP/pyruvate-binding domain-containing protein [Actinomycetota bacterium]|nr:PEP/pyruvate-binding domain-containing protein [Actinomycetota bacterium]